MIGIFLTAFCGIALGLIMVPFGGGTAKMIRYTDDANGGVGYLNSTFVIAIIPAGGNKSIIEWVTINDGHQFERGNTRCKESPDNLASEINK